MNILNQINTAKQLLSDSKQLCIVWVKDGKMSQVEATARLAMLKEIIKSLQKSQELQNYLVKNFPKDFIQDDNETINVIALVERCKVYLAKNGMELKDL